MYDIGLVLSTYNISNLSYREQNRILNILGRLTTKWRIHNLSCMDVIEAENPSISLTFLILTIRKAWFTALIVLYFYWLLLLLLIFLFSFFVDCFLNCSNCQLYRF